MVVGKLFREVMLAGTTSLDLDEIGGRENGAEQAEIEDVGAVVTGGHHAHRHADAGLAGAVFRQKIARTEQVVVGEVDGELLGLLYLGGDLDGKVGLVPAGEGGISDLVENLRQPGCVVLADGEDDGLAGLTADRVSQGMGKEGAAEETIGRIREETLLELPLPVGFFPVLTGVVAERRDEALSERRAVVTSVRASTTVGLIK